MKNFLFRIIKKERELIEYLEGFLDGNPLCVFDTETTSLRMDSLLLGIGLYNQKIVPGYISVENPYLEGIPIKTVRKHLNPVLRKMRAMGHNAKYDLFVFRNNGFDDPILEVDTAIACHIYDPDNLKNLETRVKLDLGYPKKKYEDIIGKKWDKVKWDVDTKPSVDKKTGEHKEPLITVENMGEYCCEDVYWTGKLWDHYKPLLEKDKLDAVFNKIEIPLCYNLRDMKCRGVTIDILVLNEVGKLVVDGIAEATESIYSEAGCQFNINSSQQKAEVLFDRLGIPAKKATKSGARSTDKEVLADLAGEGYPIAEMLLDYSSLSTLYKNFIRGVPNLLDKDGKLRCDFNSDGARTGRMSSSSPNLQNQPNNDKYPIRKMFIPSEGYKFIIADWSQIELRIMAHCSGDRRFMQAFENDEDIHDAVSKDLGIERRMAKIINFGVLYGMGVSKLARSLRTPVSEAERIKYGYDTTYTGYSKWKEKVETFALEHGYVKNIFGRIRRLPGVKLGKKHPEFHAALRQAVNTVIQGSAADLMKIGIIKLDNVKREKKLDFHQLLVVHDEFVIEAKEHVPGRLYHLEECYDTIIKVMESNVQLRVPIKADGKVCNNWADMKSKTFVSLLEQKQKKGLSVTDLIKFGII